MVRRVVRCSILLAALLAIPWPAVAQAPASTPVAGTVIVEWTTESEVNLAGFNVYRSESMDGPYVKLNGTLIPASPDPIAGGEYSYTDTTARAGVTYYYALEDVELDGRATMHDPVMVVAQGDAVSDGLQALVITLVLAAAGLGVAMFWVMRSRRPSARREGEEPRKRGES